MYFFQTGGKTQIKVSLQFITIWLLKTTNFMKRAKTVSQHFLTSLLRLWLSAPSLIGSYWRRESLKPPHKYAVSLKKKIAGQVQHGSLIDSASLAHLSPFCVWKCARAGVGRWRRSPTTGTKTPLHSSGLHLDPLLSKPQSTYPADEQHHWVSRELLSALTWNHTSAATYGLRTLGMSHAEWQPWKESHVIRLLRIIVH